MTKYLRSFILVILLATMALVGQSATQSTSPTADGIINDTEPIDPIDDPAYDQVEFARVMDIQQRNQDALLDMDGVTGIGIARDDSDQNFVFQITFDESAVPPPVPPDIEGVATVVVAAPAPEAQDICGTDHRLQHGFPVPMGISTSSNLYCGAGTLGFKACDGVSIGYVTNNHVAAAGGPFSCPNGAPFNTPQFHRATLDAGCALAANIGNLARFVPLNAAFNFVDAAYVRSDNGRVSNAIRDIGVPTRRPRTPRSLRFGEVVQKSGRTTGLTFGRIAAVNVATTINYGRCGSARFFGQIAIVGLSPCFFSQPGDSGSPVVDAANNPVGLLFAGGGNVTFINPITEVLARLGLTFGCRF